MFFVVLSFWRTESFFADRSVKQLCWEQDNFTLRWCRVKRHRGRGYEKTKTSSLDLEAVLQTRKPLNTLAFSTIICPFLQFFHVIVSYTDASTLESICALWKVTAFKSISNNKRFILMSRYPEEWREEQRNIKQKPAISSMCFFPRIITLKLFSIIAKCVVSSCIMTELSGVGVLTIKILQIG